MEISILYSVHTANHAGAVLCGIITGELPGTGTLPRRLTVASFFTSSSDVPREAKPISCENWAKFGSRKSGICPISSWQQSLDKDKERYDKEIE